MRLFMLPLLLASAVALAGTEDDFIYAAERCNLNLMKRMVDNGHDVNTPGSRGRTMALVSSYLCGVDQISFLIEKGADVNAKDWRGNTYLHNVASQCSRVMIQDTPKIFELLAGKQMDFSPTSAADSPVTLATRCATGSGAKNGVKILNLLVKYGANVNVQDVYRNTPMHIAIETLNDEAMRILHAGHANLEAMNRYGLTPLGIASKDMELVLTSIRRGAPPRFFTRFEFLINAGANIHVADGNGTTPLFLSLQEPILFAEERNTSGIDTLHKLRRLIQLKANVLEVNKLGDTLLHAAISHASYPSSVSEQAKRERNTLPVIRLLRSEGVDPNQKNKAGESAIDMSSRLRLNLINQALRCTAC